jgi:hypothetical protein
MWNISIHASRSLLQTAVLALCALAIHGQTADTGSIAGEIFPSFWYKGHHSSRVYYFSAATDKRKGLAFDPELLYVSAMFHDMGLTPKHSSATDRFEVDGANAAREFLRQHKIPQQDIDTVWTSIALHTTPSVPGICIRWLHY